MREVDSRSMNAYTAGSGLHRAGWGWRGTGCFQLAGCWGGDTQGKTGMSRSGGRAQHSKGPEVGVSLGCLRAHEEAGVAGAEAAGGMAETE